MTTFQNIQLKLAGNRYGRIALHLVCACQEGKLQWHLRGIIRELPKSKTLAAWFSMRQVRRAHAAAEASALARGVAAIHDTVFMTRQTKPVA